MPRFVWLLLFSLDVLLGLLASVLFLFFSYWNENNHVLIKFSLICFILQEYVYNRLHFRWMIYLGTILFITVLQLWMGSNSEVGGLFLLVLAMVGISHLFKGLCTCVWFTFKASQASKWWIHGKLMWSSQLCLWVLMA